MGGCADPAAGTKTFVEAVLNWKEAVRLFAGSSKQLRLYPVGTVGAPAGVTGAHAGTAQKRWAISRQT